MISSVRINNDEYDKEQVADFALWKAYDPTTDGENFWEIIIDAPLERGEDSPVSVANQGGKNHGTLPFRPTSTSPSKGSNSITLK